MADLSIHHPCMGPFTIHNLYENVIFNEQIMKDTLCVIDKAFTGCQATFDNYIGK